MELFLTKTLSGLVPTDQATAEAIAKIRLGSVLHGDFKKARNPQFHRKMFSLLNLAYGLWEPGELSSKYGTPEKDFERFRKDLTILSGKFHTVVRVDGTARIEADSVSFASMEEPEFEKLYSTMIDVILKHIMTKYTREDIDEMVERVLMYDG